MEGDGDALPADARSVAEALSGAGYATALFSDNVYVSRKFGMAEGFHHVFSRFPESPPGGGPVPRGSLLGQLLTALPYAANNWVERAPSRGRAEEWGAARLNEEFLDWLAGVEEERVERSAETVRELVADRISADDELLGPAPLFRLRGKHRRRLLIKSGRRHETVAAVRAAVATAVHDRALRELAISVDVDPQ